MLAFTTSDSFFLFLSQTTPSLPFSTLSLHDALPISAQAPAVRGGRAGPAPAAGRPLPRREERRHRDRKSTRLNSSHRCISYAVFCLKKKKNENAYLFKGRMGVIVLFL